METAALLLAGGLGTRIKHLLNDIPKPMAPVLGKPFLEYQIRYLEKFGITNFYLSIGYKSDVVISYFKDSQYAPNITYITENEPLGTGGAIKYALNFIKENSFFCLNADTLFLADFDSFMTCIKEKEYSAAIALMKLDDVTRYGRVEIKDDYIKKFLEKDSDFKDPAYINTGIYYFYKERLKSLDLPEKSSLEKDIFPLLINSGLGYWKTNAQFIDIGTPETLGQIEEFVIQNKLT